MFGITPGFENVMSIRNATIAMRKRKIGLFEQEHIALLDYEPQRRGGRSSNRKKKDAPQPKKTAKALWQDSH